MRKLITIILLVGACAPSADDLESGGSDTGGSGSSESGGLECPGDPECPAIDDRCPDPLYLTPVYTCTNRCQSHDDCTAPVVGEKCAGPVFDNGDGLCGIPCSLKPEDPLECQDAGMPGATCPDQGPFFFCGYR